MLKKTSDFYASLPAKCCDRCGDVLEEMADCYRCTCTKCTGETFYPLSPLSAAPVSPVPPVSKLNGS
ncbi:protein YhfH [Paenibacillus silviterrae]|uniref:protein YhfH n=1 Tax=Paenibacillus silviterrae TaxID=3242194 RepID=UPI00254355E4|nr:protein YhfH [Paenibacillus chinjuensis]